MQVCISLMDQSTRVQIFWLQGILAKQQVIFPVSILCCVMETDTCLRMGLNPRRYVSVAVNYLSL